MSHFTSRYTLLAAAALMAVALLAPDAQAQLYRPGLRPYYSGPFPAGGAYIPAALATRLQYQRLAVRNFATNTAILGRAYAQVPPYALGYNPYPPVVNYGQTYSPPYYPQSTGYVSPAAYYPLSTGYVNPYSYYPQSTGYVSPYAGYSYSGYTNPYSQAVNPYAGTSISPYGY